MLNKTYFTIVLLLFVSYHSSGFSSKDSVKTKIASEEVKSIDKYNFDIFFGVGFIQLLRVGTNIYVSNNTSFVLSYGPGYANAILQAIVGSGVPNEFYTYSIGINHNFDGLNTGLEFVFRENFHPYSKDFIISFPKFTYRSNTDKKFYFLFTFSPYFEYSPADEKFKARVINLEVALGIRY